MAARASRSVESNGYRSRPGVPHPRSYGTNARVLGRYVREEGILTLEDAVRKMSSLPAQILGLRDRGQLREDKAVFLHAS